MSAHNDMPFTRPICIDSTPGLGRNSRSLGNPHRGADSREGATRQAQRILLTGALPHRIAMSTYWLRHHSRLPSVVIPPNGYGGALLPVTRNAKHHHSQSHRTPPHLHVILATRRDSRSATTSPQADNPNRCQPFYVLHHALSLRLSTCESLQSPRRLDARINVVSIGTVELFRCRINGPP